VPVKQALNPVPKFLKIFFGLKCGFLDMDRYLKKFKILKFLGDKVSVLLVNNLVFSNFNSPKPSILVPPVLKGYAKEPSKILRYEPL
jgi:hypothetical protein